VVEGQESFQRALGVLDSPPLALGRDDVVGGQLPFGGQADRP